MSSNAERRMGRGVRAFALAALTVAVYLPAFSSRFVNWDDDRLVYQNPVIASPAGLGRIWTRIELPAGFPNYPLTFTSYWLEHRAWGLDPRGYHAVNVILHAVNAVLVYLLALALGFREGAAWWIAAMFGLHPMQVESVAWVSERKNVLSALFSLSTLCAYARHRSGGASSWYIASLLLFAAALLSKTAAVVVPLSLLLADRLWDARWDTGAIKRVAPFFALAALAALQTVAAERQSIHLPLFERPVLVGSALVFYASKLLWPFPLTAVYPRWAVDPTAIEWWAPLVGVALIAVAVWRWVKDGRMRWGVGHFACMLLPVLGLVPYGFHEYSFVADRNVYLACIGVFAALAAAGEGVGRRVAAAIPAVAGTVVLAVAVVATERQIPHWSDSRSLWSQVLDVNPAAWVAHNNLGLVLIDAGEFDAAKRHLRRSLDMNPDNPEAHNNLALALYREGDAEAAARECREALRLNPDAALYHKNLSFALASLGDIAAAEAERRAALHLDPDDGSLHYLLAEAIRAQRGGEEALPEYRRAVELAPDLVAAQNELGRTLLSVGRGGEAAQVFAGLVRSQPAAAETRYNFALALASIGRGDEALAQVDEALRLQPGFSQARDLAARLGEASTRTDR